MHLQCQSRTNSLLPAMSSSSLELQREGKEDEKEEEQIVRPFAVPRRTAGLGRLRVALHFLCISL